MSADPPPSEEPESWSSLPAEERRRLYLSSLRRPVFGPRSPLKPILRRNAMLWPAESPVAASQPAEMESEPSKRSRPWLRTSPRLRRALAAAAALCLLAFIGAIMIGHHFASKAATFDLAHLQSLNQGPRAVDRHGQFVGSLFSGDRKFVKVGEVPDHVIDALLATEDSRFYSHPGIDFRGILRAAFVNLRGMSVRQGGSTITQQLVRQAFELKGRTLQRKLLETFLALRLERAYSKAEILEAYLNQIYLGSGFYGVGAAARGYFGKLVEDLTVEEAAMIAGIIKAPVTFSPYRSSEAAERVRNLTLDRMVALGKLDREAAITAKLAPVAVLPEESRFDRPSYVIAAVERELEATQRRTIRDKIAITIDNDLQTAVDLLVKQHIERVEQQFGADGPPDQPLQAAVLVIQNDTGEILATTGGRDYRTSPFDRALQGQRPAGTMFLPLVYAAIFSVMPDAATAWVLDAPLDNRRVMIGGAAGVLGEWGGETEKPVFEGHIPALAALIQAKTGAAMRLGYHGGLSSVQERLQQCCFDTRLRDQPSVLLGSSAVRVIDVARAFSVIARGGEMPPPARLLLPEHHNAAGADGREAPAAPVSPLEARAAATVRTAMTAVLRQSVLREALESAGLASAGLAGYGGTAYGFTDAWFGGFDDEVTCVVWMGYDTPRSMGQEAWSRSTAYPLWVEIMAAATQGAAHGWPMRDIEHARCLYSGAVAGPECISDPQACVQPVSAEEARGAGECPVHQRHGAVPLGTDEVLRPVRWAALPGVAAKPAANASRTVVPQEPVLAGPDVYGAVRR